MTFLLRDPLVPRNLKHAIATILEEGRAGFRVFGGDTLMPAVSEHEAVAIVNALNDARELPRQGAFAHLTAASVALSEGKHALCVRESISAVEATVRSLTGKKSLSDALVELQKRVHIHSQMKSAIDKLYGYTNQEEGIRHPLLEGDEANVDEADAVFMFGACASLVSFIESKARVAGTSPA
ncbi:hypothetical protein [Mongoliimonas terrestris]|uniref:hypothetical protein n=1 Tax=Mongoliimonas terrestris TaxID=1709001 RepID=UPI0011151B8E|nr:hypothetical protein [Mongoliimonas terrestris]